MNAPNDKFKQPAEENIGNCRCINIYEPERVYKYRGPIFCVCCGSINQYHPNGLWNCKCWEDYKLTNYYGGKPETIAVATIQLAPSCNIMSLIRPTALPVSRDTESGKRNFWKPALKHLNTILPIDYLDEKQYFETAEHAAATELKDRLEECIELFRKEERERRGIDPPNAKKKK